MKKAIAVTLIFYFLNFLAACSTNPAPRSPNGLSSEIRAVSLKGLQKKLSGCQQSGSCNDEVLQLGYIKRVLGFFVDEGNQDVIIFGQTAPTLPPLRIDDLVIALRSAWQKYDSLYSPDLPRTPGCTIDPNPTVLQALDRLKQKPGENRVKDSQAAPSDPSRASNEQWESICQQPQTVKVFGVPADSHFAQVLVQADYDMKTLVNGTDRIETPGFVSKMELRSEQVAYEMAQHQPISSGSGSLNRFWFYPGEVLYTEDNGLILLKQCPVQLLTEQMHTTAKGEMVGQGATSPEAQAFAEGFTAVYANVAQLRPIYAELENLFRFVALANMIKYSNLNIDLKYLLEDYPVQQIPMASTLPGRSAIKEISREEGLQKLTRWLRSCGGVDIAIEPSPKSIASRNTENIQKFKTAILRARPQSDTVFWNFQDRAGRMSHELNALRVQELNQINKEVMVLTVENKAPGYVVYGGQNEVQCQNITDLLKTIDSHVKAAPEKAVYLDMRDFPSQDKVEAIASSYRMQQAKEKAPVSVKTFSEHNSSAEAQDAYFHRGIKLERESMVVEEIREGINQGQYRGRVNFFTQVGEAIRKVTITVTAKSKEIIQAFFEAINLQFGRGAGRAESLADIVQRARKKIKADFNLSDEELQIRFEDQFGNTTIVQLHMPRATEVG